MRRCKPPKIPWAPNSAVTSSKNTWSYCSRTEGRRRHMLRRRGPAASTRTAAQRLVHRLKWTQQIGMRVRYRFRTFMDLHNRLGGSEFLRVFPKMRCNLKVILQSVVPLFCRTTAHFARLDKLRYAAWLWTKNFTQCMGRAPCCPCPTRTCAHVRDSG